MRNLIYSIAALIGAVWLRRNGAPIALVLAALFVGVVFLYRAPGANLSFAATPPVIEAGDITESGNNTDSASWAVSHPAASTGDLLIFNVGWDDSTDTTALTVPAGPNGETAVVIENVIVSSGTNVRGKVVYYVASSTWSSGTLTFTPNASEQWTAAVIKVPAGEFDATTPIGADASKVSTTAGTNPSTPAVTAGASDGDGTLVAFIVGDVDDPDAGATGWTTRVSTDRGAVGANIDTRDAATTDSESIASASGWTFPLARAWVSFAYIVRGGDAPPASAHAQSEFFF